MLEVPVSRAERGSFSYCHYSCSSYLLPLSKRGVTGVFIKVFVSGGVRGGKKMTEYFPYVYVWIHTHPPRTQSAVQPAAVRTLHCLTTPGTEQLQQERSVLVH